MPRYFILIPGPLRALFVIHLFHFLSDSVTLEGDRFTYSDLGRTLKVLFIVSAFTPSNFNQSSTILSRYKRLLITWCLPQISNVKPEDDGSYLVSFSQSGAVKGSTTIVLNVVGKIYGPVTNTSLEIIIMLVPKNFVWRCVVAQICTNFDKVPFRRWQGLDKWET